MNVIVRIRIVGKYSLLCHRTPIFQLYLLCSSILDLEFIVFRFLSGYHFNKKNPSIFRTSSQKSRTGNIFHLPYMVQKAPIHQSHVYKRIKISRTGFGKSHPPNIPVKLFQNLTSGSGEDFLRMSSCPYSAKTPIHQSHVY